MTQLDYYSNILYHVALDGGIVAGLVFACCLAYLLFSFR